MFIITFCFMKLKYISTLQAKAFIFNEYHHLLLFKFAFCSHPKICMPYVPRAGSPGYSLVPRAGSPGYSLVHRAGSPQYKKVPGAGSLQYKKVP